MSIQHKGIRRKTTDVLDDYSQAHYLQNARLRRVGELGRRAGLGKSDMAQLAGPVQFMIGAWNYEPYIINGISGSVTGNSNPVSFWDGGKLIIPDGQIQAVGCTSGGTATGNDLILDLSGFSALAVGDIDITENCCYHLVYTVTVTGSLSYTGADGAPPSWTYTHNINLSPSAGGTCGAVPDSVFESTEVQVFSPNYSLSVDGYICSNATFATASVSLSGSADIPPGDYNRYNWNVSMLVELTNIYCPDCDP